MASEENICGLVLCDSFQLCQPVTLSRGGSVSLLLRPITLTRVYYAPQQPVILSMGSFTLDMGGVSLLSGL